MWVRVYIYIHIYTRIYIYIYAKVRIICTRYIGTAHTGK